MKILADVFAELRSMFLGDLTFSIAILCLVGVVALIAGANPMVAGATLLAGCLVLLAGVCILASR
jgi:hypothetical protein